MIGSIVCRPRVRALGPSGVVNVEVIFISIIQGAKAKASLNRKTSVS
jgi:hypothetical protein